jgi:uncharacterized membrane protein YhhN
MTVIFSRIMSRSSIPQVLFFVIVITYLITTLIPGLTPAQLLLKPLIVGSLIWWVRQAPIQRVRRHLYFALGFSLGGDVLLMFAGDHFGLFLGGLISFLIAHLFYIHLFSGDVDLKKIPLSRSITVGLCLVLYAMAFLVLTGSSLGALFYPVIGYMIVILTMAFMALLRKDMVHPSGYWQVSTGAILFVLSDSLLAIDKFYQPFPEADFLIMLSYSLAQYFIVSGLLIPQTDPVFQARNQII